MGDATGVNHGRHQDSQPRQPRHAARAVFADHPGQGIRVPVHRGPGRCYPGRQDPGRFDGQCAQTFANIGAALASQGASFANIVEFTTYLVHSQDIPKFMTYRTREFPKLFKGGAYPPNTLLMIDRLVQEQFLIEVSAVAAL
jgi:hypothetical protein